MKVLVTGGAGYIGSFMTKSLLEKRHEVVVLDSLERGHKSVIDNRAKFVEANLFDRAGIENLFREEKFDSVIHFAGYISMEESTKDPGKYFHNNTSGSLEIIEQTVKNGVKSFIFSSTAGVYGNPKQIPIPEDHEKNPTNPYGESKLMVENILKWYRLSYGLRYACLRYFNAAGASLDGSMGEDHEPETHIIPNAIKALLSDSEFMLYGNDYTTPDGTCVRDYIHVLDLVDAHLLALEKLEASNEGYIFNVGTGKGYSNKEVLQMIEKIAGKQLKIKLAKRRPGDAEQLIADASSIKQKLDFSPKYSDLKTIVESAWKWHQK